MDEISKDDLESKVQITGASRERMREKELLEERHVTEIEQLKAEFYKQREQLVETQRREQSVSQSCDHSHFVSQSSAGRLEQNSSIFHGDAMHAGIQQRSFTGNQVSTAYGPSSGTSASGGLGGQNLSTQADQLSYAPPHLNGFAGQITSNSQFGLGNGHVTQKSHVSSPVQDNTMLMNTLHETNNNRGSRSLSHGHQNGHFHQQNASSALHNATRNHETHSSHNSNQALMSSSAAMGYQAGIHRDANEGNGRITNGTHVGSSVNEPHGSSSWNPAFYTYNPKLPKEVVTDNGVSLELMSGPAMRVNTSSLASQIRPDLDLEDRIEQQRQLLEERFTEEKHQLRRNLQEEFTRKIEIQRKKHEESVQIFRKTNLELEYQRKEMEVKIRHQHEKLEGKYESFRSELECKFRKDTEDHRSKSSVKYETEIQLQKEKYEIVIEKQKQHVESLTIQLGELNVSLAREKDLIVAKFESEVKEIEQRLKAQKEKSDSELVVKLKSEISLLKSVNKSFREEVDRKEGEKQELEVIMKKERNRAEASYESQIIELEAHYEEEKLVFSASCEEKFKVLLQTEKISLEEALKKTEAEIIFLKKENESLRKLAEKKYVTEQKTYHERDEILQGLIKENELLRNQLREAMAKERLPTDISQSEESKEFRLNAQRELSEVREASMRIQRDLKCAEEDKCKLMLTVTALQREIEQLSATQRGVHVTKEENVELLKEVTKLNNEIDNMFEDIKEKGKRVVVLNEKLVEVEKVLGQKEREVTGLKMENMEFQNKVNVLGRQNNDLKEDLSTLRKRKVGLDDENCNAKRENSDSKGQLLVLKTTNEGLLVEVQRVKRKFGETEEEVNTLKHENFELQQEVRLLKMHQASYKESRRARNGISDSELSGSVTTSADESPRGSDKEHVCRSKKKSCVERRINKLKRSKADYEVTIGRLKEDIKALENEATKQIEHNQAVSAEFVSKRKDFEREMNKLRSSKKTIENTISDAQQQQRQIQGQLSLLEKQKKELECAVECLVEEEKRMKEVNKREINQVSATLEMNAERARREVSLLEKNRKELQDTIEKMEGDEASLRCNIVELQKESDILSQRISQMNEGVREIGRKRVSWMEDSDTNSAASLGLKDVKEEMVRLRSERDVLIRNVNELERKQTKLDISVTASERHRQLCEKEVSALTQKKKELDSAVFSLKTELFELETKVDELSAANVEQSASAQRQEIEMLRSELRITRESCDNIRSMYDGVQNEGQSKVDIAQAELRVSEDSLMSLKRERLELEKTISTLLRQKTEHEAEVAMIVDAKYREDRDTTALREERLDLDAEVMRLKSGVSGLRSVLSSLEEAKEVTERELQGLDTRREKVDRYVTGMEASLLIGQASPVSWNFNPSNDYVLTSRDDLEKQVMELKEQKLSLETDLFKLRKSGDGTDATRRSYGSDRGTCEHRVSFGHLGASGDCGVQYTQKKNESLHRELDGLTHEKSKLSSELSEMKVRKTDLDAEITNLEYRKLGLEQSGRLVQRREEERDGVISPSVSAELIQTEACSTKMDFVDYSVGEMQDLRKKNSSLEEKFGVLERNLHDAKYEMERQTLEYQGELRLLQDTIKTQETKPHQLNVIVDRLKTFIRKSELSNTDQLYEEIKNEIKELNRKVDDNSRQMVGIQEHSSNFKQKTLYSTESLLKANDVEEICGYIEEAEDGLEGYNKVVFHLQKENLNLMEIVTKLEERLTAAGKSHKTLQRKKAILQEMLEKVDEKTGEDLIQQTNLIFELDKDMVV